MEKEIKIVRARYFEGPNVHALFPVAELLVDLGRLGDIPSSPGFADKLKGALPELEEHTCSKGYKGGFLERLREGTYPGHIIEHIALSLQNSAGDSISFGKCRHEEGSIYRVVFQYNYSPLAPLAAEESINIVEMLYSNADGLDDHVEKVISKARKEFNREKLGPSTQAILEGARKRNIPYRSTITVPAV